MDNTSQLIQIYQSAQEKLIKELTNPNISASKYNLKKVLLAKTTEELKKLQAQTGQQIRIITEESYVAAVEAIRQAIIKRYEDAGKELPASIEKEWSVVNKDAVQALIEDAEGKYNDAIKYVGRSTKDIIYESNQEAISMKLTTSETVKETTKRLAVKLAQAGLTTITKNNGRQMSLSSYAELVARSTTAEAANIATLNEVQSIGGDLVQMSWHNATCPICAPLEGRVYSITGKTPGYPTLERAYTGEHANIHPNCKHTLLPYIPELEDDDKVAKDKTFSNRSFEIDERSQAKVDAYNKIQAEKAKMRANRKEYEQLRVILGKDMNTPYSAFMRAKNSNSNKYNEWKSKAKAIKDQIK